LMVMAIGRKRTPEVHGTRSRQHDTRDDR
jgi:hypothetical protein